MLCERIKHTTGHNGNEEVMAFYSTTTEFGRFVFRMWAKVGRDHIHLPNDWSDLKTVFLFIALGLLLMAVFFLPGFGQEFGRILAASG
jgi:hypothetical protein